MEATEDPVFDDYAAVKVSAFSQVPKGMQTKVTPAGICGIPLCRQEQEFPAAHCRLHLSGVVSTVHLPVQRTPRFDFAKYGESVDADGNSAIE